MEEFVDGLNVLGYKRPGGMGGNWSPYWANFYGAVNLYEPVAASPAQLFAVSTEQTSTPLPTTTHGGRIAPKFCGRASADPTMPAVQAREPQLSTTGQSVQVVEVVPWWIWLIVAAFVLEASK